jgi:putative hydrolase of the HAD superfamily
MARSSPCFPKAIIMDLDGTLYCQSTVRRHMVAKLLAFTLRHPGEGWKTIRTLKAYRKAQEHLRCAGGLASGQVDITVRMTGYPAAGVQCLIRRWMEQMPLEAVGRARCPGVIEFCQWAAERKIALAVLSDYPPHDKLAAMEVDSYIAVRVCAQEADVNCFKPNPTGFFKTLELLGAARDEVIYVGDRMDVDGVLARAIGVEGFVLGPEPKEAQDGVTVLPDWPSFHAALAARATGK